MQIKTYEFTPARVFAGTSGGAGLGAMVVPIGEEEIEGLKAARAGKDMDSGFLARLKEVLGDGLDAMKGRLGETRFFRARTAREPHYLLVGTGSKSLADHERFRRAGAFALAALKAERLASGTLAIDTGAGRTEEKALAFAEGALLANYSFDDYKASGEKAGIRFETLHVPSFASVGFTDLLRERQDICAAVELSRRRADMPPNRLTPTAWAELVRKDFAGLPVEVEIWDLARLREEKMESMLAVAKGSAEEPRLMILRYQGGSAEAKPLCFVGKGLTFDSGGLSLKTAKGMEDMKYDMCGGAAVASAVLAVARQGLKINVVGIIGATENMPGPNAARPGDIVQARSGRSIEIVNTDAEGRLVLADALSVAGERKPQAIVTIATLTGAVVSALSDVYTGVFSNSQEFFARFQGAANATGEKIWALPYDEEFLKDMEGSHSDLVNQGKKAGAGSAQAAMFLSEFVPAETPWVHLDTAGTAQNAGGRLPYAPMRGASGAMVRTLVQLAKDLSTGGLSLRGTAPL